MLKFILRMLSRLRTFLLGWEGRLWLIGVVAVVTLETYFSWHYWDNLGSDMESLSTTIRNVALVIGGSAAILLALWRSRVAERQVAVAEGSLLNERYQKGAEMLGSDVLSVRLAGIYALQKLADQQPEQFHIQILKLFCAFARHPTKDDPSEAKLSGDENPRHAPPRSREDVRAAMEAIRVRSKSGILLERSCCFRLDLRLADLRDVRLMDADVSHAILTDADLSGAWLEDANLTGARLDGADLTEARLGGADLSGVKLWSTNLSGAFLMQAQDDERDRGTKLAKGLTQEQLDWACADKPPVLKGVLDAETDKPLVWRDKPCNEGP